MKALGRTPDYLLILHLPRYCRVGRLSCPWLAGSLVHWSRPLSRDKTQIQSEFRGSESIQPLAVYLTVASGPFCPSCFRWATQRSGDLGAFIRPRQGAIKYFHVTT